MIMQVLFLMLLILLNAYFAGSEIALISLNRNKIKELAKSGNKKAQLIKKRLDHPSSFLATIQIGITLAGFLASAFASESFAGPVVEAIKKTDISISESILKGIIVTSITIILSYFTLVFGELVPKRLAMQKPDAIAMHIIRPLNFLSIITKPFVKFLTVSTNFFVKIFGGNPYHKGDVITEEEIILMLNEGEEKGTIQRDEKEMIHNIFSFDYKVASEIMTHRTAIIGLEIETTLEELVAILSEPTYTRIPVYKETIDQIVGILHVKDLIQYVNKKVDHNIKLKDLMRRPYCVPESKRVDELLKEMRESKTHIAIVIDEYGGTSGLITMEDLIEEIVGNIFDEYDQLPPKVEEIKTGVYLLDGNMLLEDIEKLLKINLPVDNYDTLSGFMIGELGKIPDEAEKPVLEFKNYVFEVVKMGSNKILKIKLSDCRKTDEL